MMTKWHAPLDPTCPAVIYFTDKLLNDPIIEVIYNDDVWEPFEKEHRSECGRCQVFGLKNIEPMWF